MPCAKHPLASRDGPCFLCPPEPAEAPTGDAERLLALQRQVHVEQARRSLSAFLRHGWHVLEPGVPLDWSWHIEVLCDHIQAMIEGWAKKQADPSFEQPCRNLIINVPPGSLKSRILSVYAPAWAWVHWPHWRLLCLSENPTVASRDARFSRELLDSDWYREWFSPQWEIRKDQDAIGDFGNTLGGARKSQGLNAKVVGLRGDAIFIDDPNDVKDASDTKLQAVWDRWYAARNRVNDPRSSIRICIMQRTHEADWTGRALEGGGWEHLSIPMEYEVDPDTGERMACICGQVHSESFLGWVDPRTKDGEVLHPERNTPAVLTEEKAALGSYGAAGQLQQRPSPLGGGMFKKKWWRSYDELECTKQGAPKLNSATLSVDATFKESGTSRCAIGLIGGKGPQRYVIDLVVDKMDILRAMREIEAMIKRHPYYTKILIEDKANGSALITMLGAKYRGVVGVNPEGGKVTRAVSMQPEVEAGNVYLPRNAPWRDEFIEEHASFPNGRYDDIVDMLSQALTDMRELSGMERSKMLAKWR